MLALRVCSLLQGRVHVVCLGNLWIVGGMDAEGAGPGWDPNGTWVAVVGAT